MSNWLGFAITTSFVTIAGGAEQSPAQKYTAAILQQKDALATAERAKELEAKAAKGATEAERKRLSDEAALLRQSVAESDTQIRKTMEELAPLDRPGFGRAHLWLVDRLYRMSPGPDGKLAPPAPKVILDIERHLLHALQDDVQEVKIGAHFGLARIYRDTGRIDDAKRHFREVAAVHPEYRLILAQWAKAENKNEEMVEHAKAAEAAYRARLAADQHQHEARFGLADCLTLQARFQEALETIEAGRQFGTPNEIVAQHNRKFAAIYLAWFDVKRKDPKSSIGERLELLEKALTRDSENPEVFNCILDLVKDKSTDGLRARNALRKIADESQGSHLAHLFLGIAAWEDQRIEEARKHWAKSIALSPTPIAMNNLAWLLAFYEPIDLDQALKFANQAVEKAPTAPQFRGTRGHILFKLKRYKDALADLEKAIEAYPTDIRLFEALTETCEKLGDPKKSAAYRKRAQDLVPPPKPEP